ncbi:hypothetical protein CDD80_6477 [Ophiocordyceps camponoti-rufipedis]|uniref:Uncharacterized protein n=1 Tax=Ophiocordyceps camponoti-rufipedis TaxID=2004952 RepID=A0A2C5YQ18_9HYPO|nr:hypothetical protein CDD80_6477 [Ophiocordyceps camponoti-rufipedis]
MRASDEGADDDEVSGHGGGSHCAPGRGVGGAGDLSSGGPALEERWRCTGERWRSLLPGGADGAESRALISERPRCCASIVTVLPSILRFTSGPTMSTWTWVLSTYPAPAHEPRWMRGRRG